MATEYGRGLAIPDADEVVVNATRVAEVPGARDQPARQAKGRPDEAGKEQGQNEQAAEDPAAHDRVGGRGHGGKQRAERPAVPHELDEGPGPLIVEGVEIAQRKLQVARLVEL